MSFIPTEPTNFFKITLTNYGRRSAALGKLKFSKAAFLDREIDYGFARDIDYNHSCNRVLMPKYDGIQHITENFDGSPPFSIGDKVYSNKYVVTAQTEETGFFSPAISGGTQQYYEYEIDLNKTIGSGLTSNTTVSGGSSVLFSSSYSASTLQDGDLLLMAWEPPHTATYTEGKFDTRLPRQFLWYRFQGSINNPSLDRSAPDFQSGAGTSPTSSGFYYPWNGVSRFYDSGSTYQTPVWNFNVVRTTEEIGYPSNASYRSYGSLEYAGFVKYIGLDKDYRSIGILHYSASDTGNTYAEQLYPKSTEVIMPTIMWHRKESDPGVAPFQGHIFLDQDSEIYYDSVASTNFTLLKDGIGSGATIVGRVYYKLKTIVITDPELLMAMSYKTNRNYTLPKLKLDFSDYPYSGYTSSSGVSRSDMNYYVTYKTDIKNPYQASVAHGYQQSMHCGYISRIEGELGPLGNSRFLTASFPKRSFPYLRPASTISVSGSGWSTSSVQLIMCEVPKSADTSVINAVKNYTWKKVPALSGSSVFSSSTTLDPVDLSAHRFIVSKQDWDSAQTYELSNDFPDFLSNNNSSLNYGMNYGDESFFFGNIKTTVAATVFKSTISIPVPSEQLNSSNNLTFDGSLDKSTYITEICILDDDNRVVGLAKPTYPIEKNMGRYLTFELEFDF